MRTKAAVKMIAVPINARPAPSILDNATVRYGTRCDYCRRKQKVLKIAQAHQTWRTTNPKVCATCALAAATFLLRFRKGK